MTKLPITFTIQPRLFAMLIFGFIIATIVGTVSHEAAHYSVAKLSGQRAKLSYASVACSNLSDAQHEKFDSLYKADKDKILSEKYSPEKEYYLNYREELGKQTVKDAFAFTLAGPVQTIIFGTTGFIILWYNRKKIRAQHALNFKNWVLVLLSFFWSRQLCNFLLALFYYATNGTVSKRGDEVKLDNYFGLPFLTLNAITGIVGFAILTWVVFNIVPKHQRLTFVTAGIFGSALGFVIWMLWIGPIILP